MGRDVAHLSASELRQVSHVAPGTDQSGPLGHVGLERQSPDHVALGELVQHVQPPRDAAQHRVLAVQLG